MKLSFTRLAALNFVALATLGAVSTASAQKQAPWDRYTIRGGEFSVLLPTLPAMTTYDKAMNPSQQARNVIAAYSKGVVYAIHVYYRNGSLEDFIAGHSTVKSNREVKVGQFVGKEIVVQLATTKNITQYFVTKRYIYSFVARSSAIKNSEADVARFFESIKFDSTEDYIAIVDGAGVQSTWDPETRTDAINAPIVPVEKVTTKALLVSRPEPVYTELARKNHTTGKVIMTCVFSSSGAITDLLFVAGLHDGLAERARDAAKQIRFIPAIKDGQFVSTSMRLEYDFNLD